MKKILWLMGSLGAATLACAGTPPLPVINTNLIFDVTNTAFAGGALGDGISNSAAAINAAINAASTASPSGATVRIRAVGANTNYLSGPISLKSHVNLLIDSGTKLQMLPMSSWSGTITFINAGTITDVEISGSGTIDGNASFIVGTTTNWWGTSGGNNAVVDRPNLIQFIRCTRALIQGDSQSNPLTLQNAPTFHLMLKNNNVSMTIQNIKIATDAGSQNTDGMDLASTNVLIQGCSISDGDDNIEIGGSSALASDITITNCTFGTGHGLSIGSLTQGGVNNLIVSNCTFTGTRYGIHIKTDRDIGGVIENLKYLDLTMNNVTNPISIYDYYNTLGSPSTVRVTPATAAADGPQAITGTTPIIRNIIMSNITVTSSIGNSLAGLIWGLPEMLVSNVILSKVNISAPTKAFAIYHAQGIQIIDSNLTAPNTTTNTLTLYDAQITVTNSAINTNVIRVGGLAKPPTNNALSFFNGRANINDTNMLGTGLITLGDSTVTFTQSSVNSFNSNIAVLAGGALVFTGGVNVINGILSGDGIVRGAVTINGTLAPGNNGVGVLTISNNLVLNAGAMLQYDLGTNSDKTVVSTNLTLRGTLNITDAGGFTNTTYTLFTYGGALTYTGLTIGTVPVANFSYVIDTNTAGQVKLNVALLPSTITAVAADLLDQFGSLMPTSGVVALVVDIGTNGFADPQPAFSVGLGATWGADDKIVGLWDLADSFNDFWGQPGGLFDQTVVIYTNGIAQGQQLRLYWFPSLTLSSNTVGVTYYGKYTDTNSPPLNGSAAWNMPAAGSTVELDFYTQSEGGSNPNAVGQATNLTVSPPVDPFAAWQTQYFGCTNCPQAAAAADPDGDGQNNEAEFLSGSDPTNSASAFRIISVTQQTTNIVVTWQAVGGRTNILQTTSGDVGGGYNTNGFTDVGGQLIIPGVAEILTNQTDWSGATNVPSRFYRVRLVP